MTEKKNPRDLRVDQYDYNEPWDKDDLHESLIRAFLEYIEFNERYAERSSYRRGNAVRKSLQKIRWIANDRRKELKAHYDEQVKRQRKSI